jgi:hypothetical protein
MGTQDETALRWMQGYAELLLDTGRFDESLKYARQVAEHHSDAYPRILLAIVEKVHGNEEPFRAVMRECPSPETDSRVNCSTVARSIALRAAGAHPAIDEIIAGRMEEKPLVAKIRSVASMRSKDPEHVGKEAAAIRNVAGAPAWAKTDALFLLATTPGADSKKKLALLDCWLVARGVEMQDASADTWHRITAMEAENAAHSIEDVRDECLLLGKDKPVAPAGDCIFHVLATRHRFALEAGEGGIARQTAGYMAVIVAGHGRGRTALARRVFETERGDSDRIYGYVAGLEEKNALVDADRLNQYSVVARSPAERAREPWDSPVQVPPPQCP